MKFFFKVFNLLTFALLVFGGLCWGIWGFFRVEVLSVFFGPQTAKVLYCVIGICGIYGVHIFVDYTKKDWGIR